MQFHHKAKAFLNNKPILFGEEKLNKSDTIIFVDTEHYTKGSVFYQHGCHSPFVIAYGVYKKGNAKKTILYENGWDWHCNIEEFIKVLEKYPDAPVITWGGNSADLPVLKKDIELWMGDRKDEIISDLESRHFDLLRFVQNNISFPVIGNSIKSISDFLGYEKREKDMWGTDAFLLDAEIIDIDYKIHNSMSYLKRKDVRNNEKRIKNTKEKIRGLENAKTPFIEKLIAYCKDDIDSLIHVYNWLIKQNSP